ncbi:hypothetical protein JAAARDRAFT_157150 [Jaapia argillacea MUCL 33604]|uniref:Formin GTPase-binding domain-containing protein n=1 Tax=Jaapia argillacea MUCL 33604 TaxID=933084 RepID=A0A067Q392_9AGAM|nr:hypothetical protein JAAARDRAFT_157150 [Jaapia argillacea MUCL 33604]
MFKGILPSKRISSSDFTIVSPQDPPTGKENHPAHESQKSSNATSTKRQRNQPRAGKDQPMEVIGTNQAFDKLLDDLQIPSTLRPKLATMESSVKAAMLKSSQTLAIKPPGSPPTLRRTRSDESIESPRPPKFYLGQEHPRAPTPSGRTRTPDIGLVHGTSPLSSTSGSSGAHTRGRSMDKPRGQAPPQTSSDFGTTKSKKEKGTLKNLGPGVFCGMLQSTSSSELDVEFVKKLRLCLRNEPAGWSQDFLREGGYTALLQRLNEILEIEWREEQHDDQLLHELLRCFKALSTSSIGCFALRSSCPTPFAQLVSLLYSDKKPGDVATRQLIVELLLILFELYPPSSLPNTTNQTLGARRYEPWETTTSLPSTLITLPAPHSTLYSLLRALLLTPAPPPSECPSNPISPHAFIESLHLPRIYKTYLQELSDVCRDYFWVFCHSSNGVWSLADTDEGRVERPRAPGGMTGGVEFEAMGYMTMHFKLINALGKAAADLNLSKDQELSAHRFHTDLFLSGFERVILIARKASTAYYPTLHLEIARYISLAGQAGYELPWSISRMIGPPPAAMCKPGRSPKTPAQVQTPRSSPTKKGVAKPVLPSPMKVEPIKMM